MALISEASGGSIPETLPSLWDRFNSSVTSYPDNLALASTHQPCHLYGFKSLSLDHKAYRESPYLRLNYRELKRGVSRLSSALTAQGVRPGMPIIYFVPNSVESVLIFWAAAEIGCVRVPINPKNLDNRDEVIHMINIVLKTSPGERLVFVAGSPELMIAIESLPGATDSLKFVVSDNVSTDDWLSFTELMGENKESDNFPLLTTGSICDPTDDIIFYTSGTTSLPKGVRWTMHGTAFIEMMHGFTGFHKPGSVLCAVAPNNHSFGLILQVDSHSNGGAVVFPGSAFTPKSMLEGLYIEKCTHAVMVPTMIHALVGNKAARGDEPTYLKNICIAGSVLTSEAVRQCLEGLGSEAVINCYGMTEGVLGCTGRLEGTKTSTKGGEMPVGRPGVGGRFKICAPNQTTALPITVQGELHYSGPNNVRSYIDQESPDFYDNGDGTPWFITGDRAIMDETGQIFIIGRYKDMIIRGGENISPLAIETILSKHPTLSALKIQVVAAPDSIAGEVPVAVSIKQIDANTAREIQNTILKEMGTKYVPDEVISIQALGFQEFPHTTTGKLQKTKLAELVRKYFEERNEKEFNGQDLSLEQDIREIWANAVGLQPEQLVANSHISDFADSITIMRVRDKIKRKTGRILTLVDMANAGTLEAQIKLLKEQPATIEPPKRKENFQRSGPPGPEDMAHLTEDPDLFDDTKAMILNDIEPYGLGWEDVAEVIPAYDFATVMATSRAMDSWSFKMALLPRDVDKNELRRAIEMTLCNNPMLASFFVWSNEKLGSDLALHVTIKHDRKLLDHVVQDGGTIKTLQDFSALALKYPQPEHATLPGPMFRSLIYHIEETNSYGLLFNMNHAVIDASYVQIWWEDFDKALGSVDTQLHGHDNYKLWADSYFSLRNSPAARAATKWHVNRLKNLNMHAKALYPPVLKRPPYDPALEATDEDGVQYSFKAPGIPALRKENRNITAPIALKAALTLLNVHRTGHSHALFANLEAARTMFPFIPKALENTGHFEATDVAGPTIQSVINLILFKPEETVVAFLSRMQEDQTNLTKYASAPWREIIASLGESGHLIQTVTCNQIFNWVPGMGSTGTDPWFNFKVSNAVVRPEVGLAVNAGLGGEDFSTIFLHLRGDGVDKHGHMQICQDLEKITKWMVETKHWDTPVGRFAECLANE